MIRIGPDGRTYEWIGNWAEFPDAEEARDGWAHPGMACGRDGLVYTSHPSRPEVLVYDPSGRLLRRWRGADIEVHHIAIVEEEGREYLWITDNGAKRLKEIGYDYPRYPSGRKGRVAKYDIHGAELARLDMPRIPEYGETAWSPTAVAVHEERKGGNGDIWVADGYGKSLVHRYDRQGNHIATLDGQSGAGRFDCPHGIMVDVRKDEPELYVADRANARIQVFDMEGGFKRSFGSAFLKRPSAFAVAGDELIVGDLSARLTVLDIDDRLVCHLGDNPAICDEPGFPNRLDGEGRRIRPADLEAGRFNSPHGLAADPDGNLYIAEWLIGGRLVKLKRVPPDGGGRSID